MRLATVIGKWLYQRRLNAYGRGYNWSAGILLSTGDHHKVLNYVEEAKLFNDYNDFDKGAEQAVRDYRELTA